MNSKYFHIGLALWIFAFVSMGFGEILPDTYSNRPTASEMNELVIHGTDCSLGVRERCFATQYSTNPVYYKVSPPAFAGTNGGWYLDQSLMGTMATKAKSLVQYYANPDTVYDGTTNISMFTVPGLFTDLDIGNHTDKFTQTFASGTNAATYGDSPWRICQENLDERYEVLENLKCCRFLNKVNIYAGQLKAIGDGTNYSDSVEKFLAFNWVSDSGSVGIHAYMDSIDNTWRQDRVRGKFRILGGYTTNLMAQKIEAYAYLSTPGGWKFYGSDAILPGLSNTYTRVEMVQNPVLSTFPYSGTTFYGNSETPIPDGSPSVAYGWFLGYESLGLNQVFITFNFQYCTGE